MVGLEPPTPAIRVSALGRKQTLSKPITKFTFESPLTVKSGHWELGYYDFLPTRSRNSLPDLKRGTNFAGTETASPDFGLRPTRGFR